MDRVCCVVARTAELARLSETNGLASLRPCSGFEERIIFFRRKMTAEELIQIEVGRIPAADLVIVTFSELQRLIKARAERLYGCWPERMTMFLFDGGSGWTVSISKPKTPAEDFYRSRTFGIVMLMSTEYDIE